MVGYSDLRVVHSWSRYRLSLLITLARTQASMQANYPDRSLMGFANPTRMQVKVPEPHLAFALTSWAMSFPSIPHG